MTNVKVKAQSNQTGSNTISASGVATTYVYVDKPAPPPRVREAAPGTGEHRPMRIEP
jgi:hypothetical protein